MEQVVEFWRLFLRRFWLITIVGTFGATLSAFYAYIKPATYEAKARILVESQQIPDDLARSTITATAAERLQTIHQRLMSRKNLQNLIEELRLFSKRDDLTMSDRINQLRSATRIQPEGGSRGANLLAFTIGVTLDTPEVTAKVANRFATIVLEENLKHRNELATDTLEYFTELVEQGQAEVKALEKQIAAFKENNNDALPDSLPFRENRLTQLNERMQELERNLIDLGDQRGALILALKAPAEEDTADKSLLRQLEAELAQKRAVLSDQHRDIRKLTTQIAELTRSIAKANQSAAEVYRQAEIKRQLDVIANEIALLQRQQQELETQRSELHRSLQRTPGVEAELNALARKQEDAQDRLNDNRQKRLQAATSAELEFKQRGEKFEIIEEAVAPQSAVSPNRKKIAVMGSGVSLILAFGLALLLDVLRPRVRSAAQMERVLNLCPVITVPYVRTRSERGFRLLKIAGLVLIVGAGIPAALYQVDQKYMPLESVAEKIADKTGVDKIIRWTERRF